MTVPAPGATVAVSGVLGWGSVAHLPDRVEVQTSARTAAGWSTHVVTYPACVPAGAGRVACVEWSASWAAHVGATWCAQCWPADGGEAP